MSGVFLSGQFASVLPEAGCESREVRRSCGGRLLLRGTVYLRVRDIRLKLHQKVIRRRAAVGF